MTIIIDGAPVAVVPASSNVCIEEEIGYRRYDDFTESSEIYDALIAVADPSLVEAILEMREALEAMRDHASRNATQWKDGGGSHHHPIWQRVAAILSRVTTGETSDAV